MKPAAHQYEDKLLELAYGELPAPEANAVESHVRTCARCTEALSEIRAVRNTMGQLPVEPVPDTGLESLYAYADQAARRNAAGPAPTATWWRKLMAPVMAAGALSIIGIVAYQTTKEGDVVPSREQVAQGVAKSDSLTAAPIAKESPPPAVAAAEPAPAEEAAAGWNQVETEKAEAPAGYEKKKELAAPAKIAARPPTENAKKMSGAELNEGLAKGAKLSLSKNRRGADDANLDQDFSNVGTRKSGEARVADKAPAPAAAPADEKQVAAKEKADKGVAKDLEAQSYGLNQPGNSGGAMQRATPRAEQERPSAPPPPPLQAQVPPSEVGRTQGGFGLGSGGSISQQQAAQSKRPVMGSEDGSLADRERDTRGRSDAPAVAAAAKPQEMRASFDAQLKAARAAAANRETEEEVRILLGVLAHNAQGSQRLEALNGVCRGLQTLGQLDEAVRYCQALVREFPDSPVARAWLDSQNRNIQRPAAKRSKQQYDYADESKPAASPPAEPATATEAK